MKSLLLASSILFSLPFAAHSQAGSGCNEHMPRQTIIYVDQTDMTSSDTVWALTLSFKLADTMMPGEHLTVVSLAPYSGTSKHPPTKQIIRSLVSDISRYKNTSEPTVRSLIYSDMAENSDLGSVFTSKAGTFVNQLNVYLVHGIFSAFGVGKTVYNADDYIVNANRFWAEAFKSMGAITGPLTSDFSLPSVVPQKGYYFNVQLNYGGDKLPGKLSLLVDKNNKLIDSWIGISHLNGTAIQGSYICVSNNCTLTAKTVGGLVGFGDHEDLILQTSDGQNIKGNIQIDKNTTFTLDGQKINF